MSNFRKILKFETNFKFLVISTLLLGALFSSSVALTPDQKNLKNALKKGNAEYFQTITKANLDASNTKNSKGMSIIQKFGIKSIPALLGAFDNKDVEVRKAIYRELLFPEFFTELGDKPLEKMSANTDYNLFLSMIRDKMLEANETDLEADALLLKVIDRYNYSLREAINKKNFKSVALMSPEFFKESNAKHEKTVVGRFGKRAVKTLVKAVGYDKGNIQTKFLILDTLLFPNTGGPEVVIPKLSVRVKRAEELFIIADRFVNKTNMADLSEKIVKVGEIYISNEFDSESR